MIKREIEIVLRNLLRGFPIVTVTGPRQSGKTTLAHARFANKPSPSSSAVARPVPVSPASFPDD
jgi:hypothetical protein